MAQFDETAFLHIVTTANEAAFNAGLWVSVAAKVRDAVGATGGAVSTYAEPTHERFLWADAGLGPELSKAYGEFWIQYDPWSIAMQQRGAATPAGDLVVGRALVPWSQLLKTDYYNEFALRAGLRGISALVIEGDESPALAPRTHLAV